MVAPSVGFTAQVLASRGWLQERASKIRLAAAAIDDVQGLIVLAVVSSLVRGTVNVPQLLASAAMALAFTWIVAKWGTRSMAKIFPGVENLHAGEAQFVFRLCCFLRYPWERCSWELRPWWERAWRGSRWPKAQPAE
jgi:Kef-type K+ transport system membrane component KefB